MAQTAGNRASGSSILNPGNAPPGGHAGYGIDEIGTNQMAIDANLSEPGLSGQTGALDKSPDSQKTTQVGSKQ